MNFELILEIKKDILFEQYPDIVIDKLSFIGSDLGATFEHTDKEISFALDVPNEFILEMFSQLLEEYNNQKDSDKRIQWGRIFIEQLSKKNAKATIPYDALIRRVVNALTGEQNNALPFVNFYLRTKKC